MTRRGYLRIGFGGVAVAIALAAASAWWFGGAWEAGAMPTHGMLTTMACAVAGIVFFVLATAFRRDR